MVLAQPVSPMASVPSTSPFLKTHIPRLVTATRPLLLAQPATYPGLARLKAFSLMDKIQLHARCPGCPALPWPCRDAPAEGCPPPPPPALG